MKKIYLTEQETKDLYQEDAIFIERDGYSILIKITCKGKPYEKIYASFCENIVVKYR